MQSKMSEENVFELSSYDKIVANVTRCGDLLVTGSAFIESAHLIEKLNENLVRQALTYLQRRHPYLRAYLDINDEKYQMFLRIEDENNAHKIELNWLDLTKEEVANQRQLAIDETAKYSTIVFDFGNKSLIWRAQVIIFKEESKIKYMVNLVLNLIITDGANIATLCIELINIVNALLTGNQCDEMSISLKPVHNLHVICDQRGLFKQSYRDNIEKLRNKERVQFKLADLFRSSNETGYILDFFKLDSKLSSKIINKSKQNHLRLTGYFQTAALYAINDLYKEYNLQLQKRLSIQTSASLRVRYDPNLEFYHCGHHTALFNFATEQDKFGDYEDFWKDAKYVHDKIEENSRADTGALFAMSHDVDLFDRLNLKLFSLKDLDYDSRIALKDEILFDVPVSNVGRFVNDRIPVFAGPFEIKEVYISDSLGSTPNILNALGIHVFYWRGEMMIQLGGNKHSIGTEYFKKYKDCLLNCFEASLV